MTIPAGAETGLVSVRGVRDETSNELPIQINRSVAVQIVLPPNGAAPMNELHVLSAGLLGELIPDGQGNVVIGANTVDADYVKVLVREDIAGRTEPELAIYLVATAFPDDASLVIDTTSTAVALVFQHAPVLERVTPESWVALRHILRSLPEVQALKGLLETELAANPLFLTTSHESEDYIAALLAACEASAGAVDTGIGDGLLVAAAPPVASARRAGYKNPPNIAPTDEQFDIMVKPYGETGFLAIENDTQMYLSARFTSYDGKDVLVPHVTSVVDPEMIGPQGWGWSYWAGEKAYTVETTKLANCRVAVCTAGVMPPLGPVDVGSYLFQRTFVERIILPPINSALGAKFDSGLMLNILREHVQDFGVLMAQAYKTGDIKAPLVAVLNVVAEDISSGKWAIPAAIVEKYGKGKLIEEAKKELAETVAAALFPGVGWAVTILENLDTVNAVTSVGLCMVDIATTPGQVEFDVVWEMKVTDVYPPVLKKPDNAQAADFMKTQRITITGAGFAPIKKGIWPFNNRTVHPVIRFIDEGEDGAEPFEVGPAMFYEDSDTRRRNGRPIYSADEILVDLDWISLRNVVGPLRVIVTHDEGALEAEWEKRLEVASMKLTAYGNTGGTYGRPGLRSQPVPAPRHPLLAAIAPPQPDASTGLRQTRAGFVPVPITLGYIIEISSPFGPWPSLDRLDYEVSFAGYDGSRVHTEDGRITFLDGKLLVMAPEDAEDGDMIVGCKVVGDDGKIAWKYAEPIPVRVLGWEVTVGWGESSWPPFRILSGLFDYGTRYSQFIYRFPYPLGQAHFRRYLSNGWHSFTLRAGRSYQLREDEEESKPDYGVWGYVLWFVRNGGVSFGTGIDGGFELSPYSGATWWFETGYPITYGEYELDDLDSRALSDWRAEVVAHAHNVTVKDIRSGAAESILASRYGTARQPATLAPELLAELRALKRDDTFLPIPARFGGTFALADGSPIMDTRAFRIHAVRPDGTIPEPQPGDMRLTADGWYLLDVPIHDATTQPDGASEGEEVALRVTLDGQELDASPDSRRQAAYANSDSTTRIDLGLHRDTVQLEIQPGWNLLSLPFAIDATPADLLAKDGTPLFTGPVWLWNPETLRYQAITDHFPANTGFWVYGTATRAESTDPVAGWRARNSLPLKRGWNLRGVSRPSLSPAGRGVREFAAPGYSPAATMAPGKGYWIYAPQTEELELDAPR